MNQSFLRIMSTMVLTVSKVTQILFFGALVGVLGCGYGFQNSHSPLLWKEKIRKIYIEPLGNSSRFPGVEDVVYNNLVRVILAHRRVKIVTNRTDADAILSGQVTSADYTPSGAQLVSDLSKQAAFGTSQALGSTLIAGTYSVAQQYTGTLGCSFSLNRTHPNEKQKTQVWAGGFSRSMAFASANQVDVPGTTSALINNSEFERAIGDNASMMMADVHESMLGMW